MSLRSLQPNDIGYKPFKSSLATVWLQDTLTRSSVCHFLHLSPMPGCSKHCRPKFVRNSQKSLQRDKCVNKHEWHLCNAVFNHGMIDSFWSCLVFLGWWSNLRCEWVRLSWDRAQRCCSCFEIIQNDEYDCKIYWQDSLFKNPFQENWMARQRQDIKVWVKISILKHLNFSYRGYVLKSSVFIEDLFSFGLCLVSRMSLSLYLYSGIQEAFLRFDWLFGNNGKHE